MKILLDMNLSPSWQSVLRDHGFDAIHWSGVGRPDAPDKEIMQWARGNEYCILTHDLDFSTLLALTGAEGPSVVQVRSQDVTPDSWGLRLVTLLKNFSDRLGHGAILTIDEQKSRIRLLPF